jgi:hypothetical protein
MAFSFSPEYGNSSTVTPSAFVGGAAFASVLALPVVGTVLFVSHRGVFSGLFNASALVSMTRMASLSGSSTALGFATDFQAPLQKWSRRFFFILAACRRLNVINTRCGAQRPGRLVTLSERHSKSLSFPMPTTRPTP